MVESASVALTIAYAALRQSVLVCGDLLQLTRCCESYHCENKTSNRLRLKFKPVASPLHH